MPQASRPRPRASAATVLAIYLAVVLAGPALFHDFACDNGPSPHCVLCACVQDVAPAAPSVALFSGDATDAGGIAPSSAVRRGVSLAAEPGDRAPPIPIG